MTVLTLKDVMNIIRSDEWFEVKFITADINKKSGGKILHFLKCRIARRQSLEESGVATLSRTGVIKPAEHNFHFTVSLELENGQIRKVHPVLIFEINNKKVA